jgi:glycosyltransferase involved in cell wall biosynthesis
VSASNDDITAVISCFNYGAYLEDAIGSLLRQDGGRPRVIVVDDGSTDVATQRVLDAIERRPEITLIRQANGGACAARNAGLERVETAYALVLDADDMLADDALIRLRGALEADRAAGYAYGHMEFFGTRSGVMRMPPFDPWRLMFRHIVGPTALMRTEMVRAIGGYDLSFRHYEDWEFWLHGLALGFPGRQQDFVALLQRKHGHSKFDLDRARYREYFVRLRHKHRVLYGELPRMAQSSSLGARERALYRWVWGARPWPARAEAELYSLIWRGRAPDTSTSTIAL